MNLFRVFLLATGVAVFLIVRFLAASDPAAPDRRVLPPAAPEAVPGGSWERLQPVPERAPESAWV
ncbi:MAG: hypothetical protein JXQ71_06475 [Verrucomicrobia bacterium]|nr:hypothetical protein [Verrucomicrobiota bacterium]